MDFKNKQVCVTGFARGIGRAITEAFLREGAIVYGIDRNAGEERPNLHSFKGDVGNPSDREAFVAFVLEHTSRIDVFVNNAMTFVPGLLSQTPLAQFEAVLNVGVSAPYDFALRLKDHLAEGSSLIQILSTRANQSMPDSEPYAAAKGALGALTHAMALSLGPKTRVNAVAPGWIDTHDSTLSEADLLQQPVGRVGKPADIAQAVMFLASERAGFVTGETLVVDGGMSRRMIYHGDDGWTYTPKK